MRQNSPLRSLEETLNMFGVTQKELMGDRTSELPIMMFEQKLVLKGKDSRPDSDYDAKQLSKGISVEKEHTDNEEVAKKVAKDHLDEMPDYYEKLEKMEKPKVEAKKFAFLGDIEAPDFFVLEGNDLYGYYDASYVSKNSGRVFSHVNEWHYKEDPSAKLGESEDKAKNIWSKKSGFIDGKLMAFDTSEHTDDGYKLVEVPKKIVGALRNFNLDVTKDLKNIWYNNDGTFTVSYKNPRAALLEIRGRDLFDSISRGLSGVRVDKDGTAILYFDPKKEESNK